MSLSRLVRQALDDERQIKTALMTIRDTGMLHEGVKLNQELSMKHMETCSGEMQCVDAQETTSKPQRADLNRRRTGRMTSIPR